MKKLIIIIISLFLIGYYIFDKHVLMYVYYNPYTSTKPFKYIGKTIKKLDKVLKKTKKISDKDGQNYDYLYFNAYGSGFIKDNNYPNDLDYEIGINLGEYNYDGKNKEEISRSILNKINSFEATFNEAALKNKNIYTTHSQNTLNDSLKESYENDVEKIINDFDLALSNKNYMVHSSEYFQDINNNYIENKITSIIKRNNIMLNRKSKILLFSHLISYNPIMEDRLREISIVTRFFATIKEKEKKTIIKVNLGKNSGVDFDRKFFAQSVYTNKNSAKFLNKINQLNNDKIYLKTKFSSFEELIETIPYFETNIIKQAKRTIQLLDFLQNIIDEDFYKKSRTFLSEILTNNELGLLNEYINTYENILQIAEYPELFFELKQIGELDKMYSSLIKIEESLYKNGKIDKKLINKIINFRKEKLNQLLTIKNEEKLVNSLSYFYKSEYNHTMVCLNSIACSQIKNYEFMSEILKEIEKILKDFGYNEVSIIYSKDNTITFIENDFIENIDDIPLFLTLNDYQDFKFNKIKEKELPPKYQSWIVDVRYYSTEDERDKYKKIKEKFLQEKNNFKLKYKFAWIE